MAEWVDLARLVSDRSGSNWSFKVARDTPRGPLFEKFCKGPVAAMLRQLRGGLTLHASSVAWNEQAIAFVGNSGAGKSTLAAAIALRTSAKFISDDTAPVVLAEERALITPCELGSWLNEESLTGLGLSESASPTKTLIPSNKRLEGASPLRAIVEVQYASEVSAPRLEPIRGGEAFLLVSRAMFRFALDSRESQIGDLDNVAGLVARSEVWRLIAPAGFDQLPRVVDYLEEQFGESRNPTDFA